MGENSVRAQEPGVDLYVLCKRKAMSQATLVTHGVTKGDRFLGDKKWTSSTDVGRMWFLANRKTSSMVYTTLCFW